MKIITIAIEIYYFSVPAFAHPQIAKKRGGLRQMQKILIISINQIKILKNGKGKFLFDF